MPLLEVTNLAAGYNIADVLRGVSFAVEQGGITAVLGANGAGKTTLLRAVSGMLRRRGSIRFDGRPIETMATEDIARLGVAHVPDGRGTFLDLTTEENLRIGAYTRKDRAAVARDLERVFTYFPRLKERRYQQAGTLSGGEQQMLAVSRALMLRPRLLLLDEPSFGLAPLVVQDIFSIMRAINAEEGVSVLLVEQNAGLALDLADNAYVLETGQVVMSGTTDAVRSDEAVRRAYLGY
ncbi:MAG TPA: ABC transporter ATP-binding protein [Burkholderiales bacterium]|jgi:branched-chain amino acid transport system ATP-binding protein|nr:ABC transporter ATP-binding protein [Burkholderiales bacterium]